jgi:hypothetical protein
VRHDLNLGQRCDAAEKAEKTDGIVGLLRDRGAGLTARSAVILGDENVLRSRHQEEDLVTPRDDRGWLLGLAVDCDRPEILKLLLEGRFPRIWTPSGEEKDLRQLLIHRHKLVRIRVQVKNEL